jgi:predicted acetyltransferase
MKTNDGMTNSRECPAATLPSGSTLERSTTSLHYVHENKVTYNFWKNLAKTYLIELKRVNAWRQAENTGSLHYVHENKVTYNFWKNLTETYLIELKRVNTWRQAASAASLHYVTETKRVIDFMRIQREYGYC